MSFERFNKGIYSNFSYLNKNIASCELQDKYYQKCMQQYSTITKKKDIKDIIEWSIRIRKSLKEIFTSALFYVESEKCKTDGCFASTYYLRYYSLFHAMLSNLFLDEKQKISELMDINHTKVVNCFVSNYCSNSFPIIDNEIKENFNILKFMREYYSYTMPMNEIFSNGSNGKWDEKEINLRENIIQCFQLANFLVVCIENSFSKNFTTYLKIDENNKFIFDEIFKMVNGKKSPNSSQIVLDNADINECREILKDGISIDNYNLDLEHFCDEFRSYNCFKMNKKQEVLYSKLSSEAIKLVYAALILGE